MSRTSLDYFEDIVDAMQNAQSFVGGLDYSDFANDKKTTFATARAIQIIGEATNRIPEDVRNRFPNIPWSDMAGMRDRVVHAYFSTDLPIVWDTVTKRVPEVLPELRNALRVLESEESEP